MGEYISFWKNVVDRRRHAGSSPPSAPAPFSLDAHGAAPELARRPMPARLGAAWYSAPMDIAMRAFAVLPWLDWVALALFFPAWAGYAIFAKRRVGKQPSLLATTNRVRRQWMLQTTYREVRVVDGVVIQNLSTSPSFFASTTILIIGGLLAVLGTADKASELVRELPFAARTSALVFDLKLLLLLAIFVYAFFRFTWSMRQYTFGALLVAAAARGQGSSSEQNLSREAFADKAGRIVGMAAETFNDGLRGYYFAFAAIGWFFSPIAFMVATVGRRLHPLPARVRLRGAGRAHRALRESRSAPACDQASRARRTPLNCHCASGGKKLR